MPCGEAEITWQLALTIAYLHGNRMEICGNKVAENKLELNAENKTKRRRGRPTGVDNGPLWGIRDHLVWLLETTWSEVGWNLRSIKTAADVRPALQAWDQRQDKYVVQMLLRSSDSPAKSKLLNERRRQLGELDETVRNGDEFLEKCWESFQRAMRIPATQ